MQSTDTEDELTERTTLITEEKAATGNIKLSVILAYCRACTWPMTVITVLFFVLAHGASIASNFWLAKWSNAQANVQAYEKNRSVFIQRVTCCDGVNGSSV